MKKSLMSYSIKSITLLSVTMTSILCVACGGKEKKDNHKGTEQKGASTKVTEQSGINLKQNGDYTQLYAENENCKLTTVQFAEAVDIEEGQVILNNSYMGSCWFKFSGSDNLETNYGVSLQKLTKDVINNEISSAKKSELIDIQVSESGDTYITRHPVQGFLLLLNPNYTNAIKVSYSYFNPNNPSSKLTEAQVEARRQNTYKIANYLINHYNK